MIELPKGGYLPLFREIEGTGEVTAPSRSLFEAMLPTADPLPVRELIADSRIADFLLGEVYSPEMSCVARLRAGVLNGEAQGCEAVAVRAMRNFL